VRSSTQSLQRRYESYNDSNANPAKRATVLSMYAVRPSHRKTPRNGHPASAKGFCFSVRGEERVQVSARWEALRCEHVPTNIVHLPREHETKKKKPPKRRHAGDMSLRQGMSRWNRAEPF